MKSVAIIACVRVRCSAKTFDEGRSDIPPPDVALLDVSPPDHNGFVSLGAGVWDKKELVKYVTNGDCRGQQEFHPHRWRQFRPPQ